MLQANPSSTTRNYSPRHPAKLLSLRGYLIRLVLLLVIPVTIFAAALLLVLTRHEKAAVRSEMEAAARALQIMVDGELESVIRTLQSLTTSTYLLSGDMAGFRGQAERVSAMQKGWESITLLDRSGKNLVSLRAGLAHEVLDQAHFDLVVLTGKPAVQNLKQERLVGVTVPVMIDGETEYVLNACLRTDLFVDVLTREDLPPPWIGVIYDGGWRVIGVAHPDAVEPLAELDLSETIRNADRGWVTAKIVADVVSYIAFSKSAVSQWSAAIAVPSASVDTPIHRRLFIISAAGLLILTMTIWMALISAGNLARPVERLSENSSALGGGSFFAKPTSSIKEIRNLEESFQQADREVKSLTAQLEQRVDEHSARQRQEIAEKDRSQESLRRQTEFLELSHEGVFARDFGDSRIVFWSTSATRLYGWNEQEALGKISHELLQTHFPQPVEEIQNQLSRDGRWDGELTHTRKDGTRIIVATRWSLRMGPTGQPPAVLELGYDITEKKNAEQKLWQNERLASLGLTAAVFAHEVANPLNNLNGSLVLLDRELANAGNIPGGLKLVRAATAEIGRLNTLLEEFRSLARPQTLTRRSVNLHEIVEEVVAPLQARQTKLTVELDFDDSLPQIVVDREKIKQVVINLSNNSVEAMPDGGRLTLKSSCSGTSAILQVSDTGVGIPAGMDVFHLFTTTKPHGTGLGLAIVKQIISAHRGTIDYVSRPEQGTTFTIALPLYTNEFEQMEPIDEI